MRSLFRQLGKVARSSLAALAFASVATLAVYEGYTDHAVIPVPGDVPTYGHGSTTRPDGTPVQLGDTITRPEAVELMRRDVARFEGAIKRCVHVALYQHEYDAYVQLAYNIGAKAFCGSTLVRKLNVADYAGACAEISRWDRMQGRPIRGLTIRRAKERALCEGRL